MAEGMLNFTRPGDPVDVLAAHPGPADVPARRDAASSMSTAMRWPPARRANCWCADRNTINGYYRAEEANARSFSPDGYYRSGDRVRIFADGPRAGYVEVTGRIKDVIHRGGETVSASDLEEHLFAHPGIYAAAAVAMPDELSRREDLRRSRFLRARR